MNRSCVATSYVAIVGCNLPQVNQRSSSSDVHKVALHKLRPPSSVSKLDLFDFSFLTLAVSRDLALWSLVTLARRLREGAEGHL